MYSNIYINVSNAKKELTNSDKYKSLVKEVTNSIEKKKKIDIMNYMGIL